MRRGNGVAARDLPRAEHERRGNHRRRLRGRARRACAAEPRFAGDAGASRANAGEMPEYCSCRRSPRAVMRRAKRRRVAGARVGRGEGIAAGGVTVPVAMLSSLSTRRWDCRSIAPREQAKPWVYHEGASVTPDRQGRGRVKMTDVNAGRDGKARECGRADRRGVREDLLTLAGEKPPTGRRLSLLASWNHRAARAAYLSPRSRRFGNHRAARSGLGRLRQELPRGVARRAGREAPRANRKRRSLGERANRARGSPLKSRGKSEVGTSSGEPNPRAGDSRHRARNA